MDMTPIFRLKIRGPTIRQTEQLRVTSSTAKQSSSLDMKQNLTVSPSQGPARASSGAAAPGKAQDEVGGRQDALSLGVREWENAALGSVEKSGECGGRASGLVEPTE